jgi:glutathione S-transferase
VEWGRSDPANRAELLLLSPSILVPCLTHDGIRIWDTLAIAEYLNEVRPKAGLLPAERPARARCRSICGEMHSAAIAVPVPPSARDTALRATSMEFRLAKSPPQWPPRIHRVSSAAVLKNRSRRQLGEPAAN